MSEVPLYRVFPPEEAMVDQHRSIVPWKRVAKMLHGYLAHEKTPAPLETPKDPTHRPTVGSWGVAFSCK